MNPAPASSARERRSSWTRGGPAALLAVLVLAVVVMVVILEAIGTDATFAIESDALVRRTRRSVTRVPWEKVLELRYTGPNQVTPGAQVWVLLRSGGTMTIHARRRDQGPELEGFFLAMRAHVPPEREG